MKFYSLLLFLLILFSNSIGFAQKKTVSSFEKVKGTLNFPVSGYQQITRSFYDSSIRFRTNSACPVNSIFNGVVLRIKNIINGGYIVIIQSDDFFVSYIGLTIPLLKEGDNIKTGQQIASVFKSEDDNQYYFDLYISTSSKDLNPCAWFKNKKVIQQIKADKGVY